MSIFKKLTTEGAEKAVDRLGGGFQAVPSDIYDVTIKMAYVGNSAHSKAMSVTLIATMADNKELRETIWITNKDNENTYADKQDAKKKHLLPGFITVNDICLLATGNELSEQETEEKMVKIYNSTEKKEVPTAVQVITDLIGKKVKLGVLRKKSWKQKRDDSGNYVNTDQTRDENTIDKVFHADNGRTVQEYMHGVDPAEFMPAWEKQNKGKDRDDTTRAQPAAAAAGGIGGTGRPGGAAGPGTAKKNIFGA